MANPRAVVVGGGPAGFFGAFHCASIAPKSHVTLLEGSQRPLTKILVSGGGRCNVTHHCFEPADLVKNYPRGGRELLGAFNRFQPKDTVAWFEERGVRLKTEADGRMFPVTDDSRTIAACLQEAARAAQIEVKTAASVLSITRQADRFKLSMKSGEELAADAVLLATGSGPGGHSLARSLGHTITPLAPSLFTFVVRDERLRDLAGVAFEGVALTLEASGAVFKRSGPLLITHWGLSGPAVLKLSAFAALQLNGCGYKAKLRINFLAGTSGEKASAVLASCRDDAPKKKVARHCPFPGIPRRFWERLTSFAEVSPDATYAELSRSAASKLARELTSGEYAVSGKGVFKEEFVTAGGVSLSEVDFRTMSSRVHPALYFAGEILDIDGITGGFNFQAGWTTGWIAGRSMGAFLDSGVTRQS